MTIKVVTSPVRIDLTTPATPLLVNHLNLGGANNQGEAIAFTSYYMLRNNTPTIPVMGEFHYARFAAAGWRDAILRIKAGGVTILATYLFWNYIEEEEGVFDWTGNNDLRAFLALCAELEMEVILRIGPFAHGEVRNGGLPDWLYGRPFRVRSSDAAYLRYAERFYRAIAEQAQGFLFRDNGPVIGIQLENEYMHCGAPWEVTFRAGMEWVPAGDEGAGYIALLKQMARDAGFDVPLYTVTGWLRSPVPDGEVLPMQGGYAYTPWSPDPAYRQQPTHEFLFRNRHLQPVTQGAATYDGARYPLACCEIGGGIQITYYHRPLVPPASVEALAVVNLGSGANLLGWYMYHGGTNRVGKGGFLNEYTVPRRSYDFQAPLREFGQIGDSFRSLRVVHAFLREFGALLAPMQVALPAGASAIEPADTESLRCAARHKDGAGFVFLNNFQDHVAMRDQHDVAIALQTARGDLRIPRMGGITLQQDTCAILPFGLLLGSVRLAYATTQLLTRLHEKGAGETWVFFAPQGMASEYVFDAATCRGLSVTDGEIEEDQEQIIVRVSAGVGCMITLVGAQGETVRLITLTRAQAEQACKQVLGGSERLIVSSATVVPTPHGIELGCGSRNDFSLLAYPPLAAPLETSLGALEGREVGLFTQFAGSAAEQEIGLVVLHPAPGTAIVRLAPDALADALRSVDDLMLQITYIGDMGECYVNGRLLHDNFYNGTVWEIGLKHLLHELADGELVLRIQPLRPEHAAVQYVPTGMAFRPATAQDGIAEIQQVALAPHYKVRITNA